MQVLNTRCPWNMRALLESTATPFTIARYAARAAIYRQGDPCDRVVYIESGRVWLAVTAQSGKEAIASLVDAGAFLGEEALAGCAERRRSATAMTDTQVLSVSTAHMRRLLCTEPALVDRFMAHLLERHSRLEDNLTEQLLYSSEQRLAHLLLVLAECHAGRTGRCGLPHLSQEIIAEMVGTTRSRVNAFMGRFRRFGFVESQGGRVYVNPGRLRAVQDRFRHIALAAPAARRQRPEAQDRYSPTAG